MLKFSKEMGNYLQYVKMIDKKTIWIKKEKRNMTIVLLKLKTVILTYGLESDWRRRIQDRYGKIAHIIDITEQYQDLVALRSDVIIINSKKVDRDLIFMLKGYFNEVGKDDLPDLFFTEEMREKIPYAKIWGDEERSSPQLQIHFSVENFKNIVIVSKENKKEINQWISKNFTIRNVSTFWNFNADYQIFFEKDLERFTEVEKIHNSTLLCIKDYLGICGLGMSGLGMLGLLIEKNSERYWITFWDNDELQDMFDEQTFVAYQKKCKMQQDYLPKEKKKQVFLENIKNMRIKKYENQREYYIFFLQDEEKKDHILRISKGRDSEIYCIEYNTNIWSELE